MSSESSLLSLLGRFLRLEVREVREERGRPRKYFGVTVEGEEDTLPAPPSEGAGFHVYGFLIDVAPRVVDEAELMCAYGLDSGVVGRGFLFRASPSRFLFMTDASLPPGRYVFSAIEEEALLEMQLDALDAFAGGGAPHILCLHRILLGEFDGSPVSRSISSLNSSLDASQREAVSRGIALTNSNPFLLIQGPPGTGKTKTIAEITVQLAHEGERVLITSHTNIAVDNALETILSQGDGGVARDIIRFGSPLKVTEGVRKVLSMDVRHLISKPIVGATISRLLMLADMGVLNWLEPLFDVAIVDESSMATIPLTVCAAMFARTFVLVGDHMQLPPVVRCLHRLSDSDRKIAGLSLFEYLTVRYPERKVMLDTQYRSHPSIVGFSSEHFYGGRLRSDPSVEGKVWIPRLQPRQRLRLLHGSNRLSSPILWFDTGQFGEVAWARFGGRPPSAYNLYEAAVVVALMRDLKELGLMPEEAFVITPFRLQATLLRQLLRCEEATVMDLLARKSSTVDSFQGRQLPLVVYCFTSTNPWSRALRDRRRLNVALTRAESKLILVGAASKLSEDPFYNDLLDYFSTRSAVVDAPHPGQLASELRWCERKLAIALETSQNSGGAGSAELF